MGNFLLVSQHVDDPVEIIFVKRIKNYVHISLHCCCQIAKSIESEVSILFGKYDISSVTPPILIHSRKKNVDRHR